jgi:sulfur-oxidizing protein SoxY
MALVLLALSMGMVAAGGVLAAWAGELDTPQWVETRAALFQDRPIHEDADAVIRLEVPLRPDDAAAVPVQITLVPPRTDAAAVKALYIVIDRNPEPLAGVFTLGPAGGAPEIQTRLRVETHSPVRAIAEMTDGRLLMATKLVKAAGGCAAPPVMITAPPNLGRIQLRAQDRPTRNEPTWAQVIVVHPNHTGFQRHPLTTLPISAHYVTEVAVTFDRTPVLTATTTIAMSEDPDVRFSFTPTGPGLLEVDVKDSRGQRWRSALAVAPR